MLSNEQVEELRNYFQVKSGSGIKLPNIKTMTDGSSFYLQNKNATGEITYIKYTVINGTWYREQEIGMAVIDDGTYTVGLKLTGGGTDGTITTKDGFITAITQAT